jgi:hypothetical protein
MTEVGWHERSGFFFSFLIETRCLYLSVCVFVQKERRREVFLPNLAFLGKKHCIANGHVCGGVASSLYILILSGYRRDFVWIFEEMFLNLRFEIDVMLGLLFSLCSGGRVLFMWMIAF